MNITSHFTDILAAAEKALDATPDLTRVSKSGLTYEAEIVFSRAGYSVKCMARNTTSKGRGSKVMVPLHGDGDLPETALANFLERLPIFAKTIK